MAGRRPRGTVAPDASALAPRTNVERVLLAGVRSCLGLVLAMPLVVVVDAAHGFIVGKALLAYTAIEVALVLWTLLVLANPAFLPPRSKLLALLALGLAWGVVAAGFGASWQRSLWSTYPRMGGLVGGAHWLAFSVLVAAVFRPRRLLRGLISVNLGVSVVVAALALLSAYELPLPLYGPLPERDFPRIGGVVGNAIPMGVYAVLNVALALTLLATDLAGRGRTDAEPAALSGSAKRLALRLFWALAAIANCMAFSTAGSLTAAMAVLGGGALCAGALALGSTGRWRVAAIASLALASTAAIALAAVFLFVEPAAEGTYQHPLVKRIAEVGAGSEAALDRLYAWQAGSAGFLARPMLGWGPENFLVVFGRYGNEGAALAQPHADAHNAWVEKIATEGLPGVACLFALWVVVAMALLRAGRRAAAGERGFVLGLAAVLTGVLAASMTANWNITTNLLFMLLLAAVAQLEAGDAAAPGRVAAVLAQHRPLRLGLAVCAAALAVAGVAANHSLYRGAIAFGSAAHMSPNPYDLMSTDERVLRTRRALASHQRAIAACDRLANRPRRHMFGDLEVNWWTLRVRHSAEAKRWLEYADAQAAKALATEPENWLLHQSLARLYRRVASTDPEYGELAAHYVQSSLKLAPNMPIYRPPLK